MNILAEILEEFRSDIVLKELGSSLLAFVMLNIYRPFVFLFNYTCNLVGSNYIGSITKFTQLK